MVRIEKPSGTSSQARTRMSTLLAIDPGNRESGWVVIDKATCKPLQFGKTENGELLADMHGLRLHHGFRDAAIEMVASYGMPVGREVFDTCVWIGRFYERLWSDGVDSDRLNLVYRQPVKLHHCHSTKANDATVKRALVDRFAPGQTNYGKGTKAAPGFFYGFSADVWQAYALAVYAADTAGADFEEVPFR